MTKKSLAFKYGFPDYATDEAGNPRIYEIKLKNGKIRRAIVENDERYGSGSLIWKNEKTGQYIIPDEVVGWREIPEYKT